MKKIKNFYKNKKILVTGATGFKGSWLCSWLLKLGAKVYGIGFNSNKNKNLFYKLNLNNRINLKIFDVRDYVKLKNFIYSSKPSIVFHLAAQPIIYNSYQNPFVTIDTNFRSTLNVLEIAKKYKFIKSVVLVSTIDVYENVRKSDGYKETDMLGGIDPYSASKAASELIIRSYRESFFINKKNCGISSTRAGNVIAGGDWSEKRLIPTCIRSLIKNKVILLRNPKFVRPWQFVLEPIKGYLILAKKQFENPSKYSGAWNFGPDSKASIDVQQIVKYMISYWGKGKIRTFKNKNFTEHQRVKINATKARKKLGWFSTYDIKNTVKITTEWYFKVLIKRKKPLDITNEQIESYMDENNWS